jgi:hypothetical protein
VTVKAYLPLAVGLPEIVPDELNVRPGGKPADADQA